MENEVRDEYMAFAKSLFDTGWIRSKAHLYTIITCHYEGVLKATGQPTDAKETIGKIYNTVPQPQPEAEQVSCENGEK